MASGLTDHIWTIKELLMTVVAPNSRLGERFDYADVRQPAHAAAAQSQSDLAGVKHMKRVIHRPGLYTGGFAKAAEAIRRLRRIKAALEHLYKQQVSADDRDQQKEKRGG